MLGKDLRLLITLNEVKAYDVARVMGLLQTTITRLCQASRELNAQEFEDVLNAMETLRGEPLVTGVDFSKDIPKNLERSIKVC